MPFVIRKFDHQESLGDKLKSIRRCANITLSEIEKTTKIRKCFLKAFESGDYSSLPDPIYARNYLKVYVQTLGADVNYFLDQFEKECGTCDFTKNVRLPMQKLNAFKFLVASKFVKIFCISVLALCLTTYMVFQVAAILSPPELIVFEPKDGLSTDSAILTVTGRAEDSANVKINGADILLMQDGTFETDVSLERGLNIIEIESAKRYSRSAIEYRRVLLNQNFAVSLLK